MSLPLVLQADDRDAVRRWIDGRIGQYQAQKQHAINRADKLALLGCNLMIDELLDVRNRVLGVPDKDYPKDNPNALTIRPA